MNRIFVAGFFILFLFLQAQSQDIYVVSGGSVSFKSEAPLELIQAKTASLTGLLKTSDRSFAFRVPMATFDGFNSSLQKTHFNENYLETATYQHTTFQGKIIEEIDLTTPGTYNVRGKGKFTCHGISSQRIIKCKVVVQPGKITITSDFTVFLADHDISIPSVVRQKIAEEIKVHIDIVLVPKT